MVYVEISQSKFALKLLKFIEFDTLLLEKSIGSEEIRKKWYPDFKDGK